MPWHDGLQGHRKPGGRDNADRWQAGLLTQGRADPLTGTPRMTLGSRTAAAMMTLKARVKLAQESSGMMMDQRAGGARQGGSRK
jgi:hypothetical protein